MLVFIFGKPGESSDVPEPEQGTDNPLLLVHCVPPHSLAKFIFAKLEFKT